MSVAVITGGSSGLGMAFVRSLAEQNWDVITDARNRTRLHEACRGLGDRVHALPGDVTDPAHRAALVERAAQLDGPDLLVNNAGGLGPSPLPALADLATTDLADLFAVNVLAPLALTQLALPALTARAGTVVNITSDAASAVYPGWGGYGSTKAALEQLSAVLGAECTGGLRVYTLDPGDLRTPMHQAAFPGEDISDRPLPQTVVPALDLLVRRRPPSGRYRAADLLEPAAGQVRA